jgi:tetratricopeptide (TPR) repeat protein
MDRQLSPNEIETHNNLYQKAWDCLKGNIILDDVPHSSLGFFARRRVRSGIKLFEQALQINPSNWQAMFGIAKAYQGLDKLEEALSWFHRAFAIDTTNQSLAKEVGGTAGRLSRHTEAIAAMERIDAANRDASLHSNLGLSYLMTGRVEDAEQSFRRAVEAEPSHDTTRKLLKLAEDVGAKRCACPRTESEIIELIGRC